jgi:hypothetical protein
MKFGDRGGLEATIRKPRTGARQPTVFQLWWALGFRKALKPVCRSSKCLNHRCLGKPSSRSSMLLCGVEASGNTACGGAFRRLRTPSRRPAKIRVSGLYDEIMILVGAAALHPGEGCNRKPPVPLSTQRTRWPRRQLNPFPLSPLRAPIPAESVGNGPWARFGRLRFPNLFPFPSRSRMKALCLFMRRRC